MVQLQLRFEDIEEISEEDIEAAAEKFDDIKANPEKYFKKDNSKIIETLRKRAESLKAQAEKINTSVTGNWTYRRQSFADSAAKKKERMLKKATALERLAVLWETDSCPEILKNVRSASDFDIYYPRQPESGDHEGGWYRQEYPARLKKALKIGLRCPDDNKIFDDEIKKLSEIVVSPEEAKKKELERELVKLRSANIPGFFPTPDELIDKMIDYAFIQEEDRILEPSAGIGSILDRIRKRGFTNQLCAVEISPSLFRILELKGYNNIAGADILTDPVLNDPEREDLKFEKILMNPPFEKGQDIDHVLHCFNNFLKPGGTLVSIMSASVQFNSTKKFLDFREFMYNIGAELYENGQMFIGAFKSTGVNTITLKITKPY
jgi:phospholipid N-methyltransferase